MLRSKVLKSLHGRLPSCSSIRTAPRPTFFSTSTLPSLFGPSSVLRVGSDRLTVGHQNQCFRNRLFTNFASSPRRAASSLAPNGKLVPASVKAGPDGEPLRYRKPQVLTAEDGREVVLFDMRRFPKLKPGIIHRRRQKLRTYVGQEKNIRHSPWKMNLVCQFAARLPVPVALTQLEFCKKGKAPLVQRVIQRTANLASVRDNLQPSQLEVAECFATKGSPLKRIRIMGRGRFGRMEHKHSHIRVVLREIDFPLRIFQAQTVSQKKYWFQLQQEAARDAARVGAERAEVQRLERELAEKKSSK